MRMIDLIVIHCSATPASMDVGVAQIRHWHMDKPPIGNGWADVGYHLIIRRNGVVEKGRPLNTVGAHVQGHNAHSIGICLVGGTDVAGKNARAENNFTFDQMQTLKAQLLVLHHQFPRAQILGHRDVVAGKQCPSFSVRDWLVREGITQAPEWA